MKVLAHPDIKEKFANAGVETTNSTPEQFTELVSKEIAKWADVVKRTGAKLD